MERNVMDPAFWKLRLHNALLEHRELHRSVYDLVKVTFDQYADMHRKTLEWQIRKDHSVLDLGCGYGRLLELMPERWTGPYLGLDISPDFIAIAREKYATRPNTEFHCCDIRKFDFGNRKFDWAIAISLYKILVDEGYGYVWEEIKQITVEHCHARLVMEYGDAGKIIHIKEAGRTL